MHQDRNQGDDPNKRKVSSDNSKDEEKKLSDQPGQIMINKKKKFRKTEAQNIDFGHKFLMHKDIAGKKVIACGSFYNDTTSIDQQIHEAVEDAKSMTMEEAKKKFTTPLISVGFQATGVKVLED